MSTVLVTGATGFLGRHVVELLMQRGIHVVAHGRSGTLQGVAMLHGALDEPDAARRVLTAEPWRAIVNLAGPVTGGSEDLETGIDVVSSHVRIALHLQRHAAGARIVHASSMTVYGMPDQQDVPESHPRRPRHLYGLAKVLAEDVLRSDPPERADVWILRLPGLFSERRQNGALHRFCCAVRERRTVQLTATKPTPWSVLHVEDAAGAIVAAVVAPRDGAGTFNIAHDEPIELCSIARAIIEIGGGNVALDAPLDVVHPPLRLVNDRAKRLLMWRPPALRERLSSLYHAYAAT